MVQVGIVSYGAAIAECGGDANMGAYTSVMAMRAWLDRQFALRKL